MAVFLSRRAIQHYDFSCLLPQPVIIPMADIPQDPQQPQRTVRLPQYSYPESGIANPNSQEAQQLLDLYYKIQATEDVSGAGVHPVVAASKMPEFHGHVSQGNISPEFMMHAMKTVDQKNRSKGSNAAMSEQAAIDRLTQLANQQSTTSAAPPVDTGSSVHLQDLRDRVERFADIMNQQQQMGGKTRYDQVAEEWATKLHTTVAKIKDAIPNLSDEQINIIRGHSKNQSADEARQIMLQAAPGSGKTVMAQAFALQLASEGVNLRNMRAVSPTHAGTDALSDALAPIRDILPQGTIEPSTLNSWSFQELFTPRQINGKQQTVMEHMGMGDVPRTILTDLGNETFETIGGLHKAQAESRQRFLEEALKKQNITPRNDSEVNKLLSFISENMSDREHYKEHMSTGEHSFQGLQSGQSFQAGKDISPELALFVYEQTRRAQPGFQLSQPQFQNRMLDQDELVSKFGYAASRGFIPPPPTLVVDEAQDMTHEMLKAVQAFAERGSHVFLGGDPSQATMQRTRSIEQFISSMFPRMQQSSLTGNYRMNTTDTALINTIGADPRLQGMGVSPQQVSMRGMGQAPAFHIGDDLQEMNRMRVASMFQHMGMTPTQLIQNIRTGQSPFAGAQVKPQQIPAISQTGRTRDQFRTALFGMIKSKTGSHEEAEAIMKQIYSESTPNKKNDQEVLLNLKIAQARSRAFDFPHADVTRTGKWGDSGYLRNLYTMLSRARERNIIFGSRYTFQHEAQTYGASHIPENLGGTLVPHGFTGFLKGSAQNMLRQDKSLSQGDLPDLFQTALSANLSQSIQKSLVTPEFPLQRFLKTIFGLNKFASSGGNGIEGMLQASAGEGMQSGGDDSEHVMIGGMGTPQKLNASVLSGQFNRDLSKPLLSLRDYVSSLLSSRLAQPASSIGNLVGGVFPDTIDQIVKAAKKLNSGARLRPEELAAIQEQAGFDTETHGDFDPFGEKGYIPRDDNYLSADQEQLQSVMKSFMRSPTALYSPIVQSQIAGHFSDPRFVKRLMDDTNVPHKWKKQMQEHLDNMGGFAGQLGSGDLTKIFKDTYGTEVGPQQELPYINYRKDAGVERLVSSLFNRPGYEQVAARGYQYGQWFLNNKDLRQMMQPDNLTGIASHVERAGYSEFADYLRTSGIDMRRGENASGYTISQEEWDALKRENPLEHAQLTQWGFGPGVNVEQQFRGGSLSPEPLFRDTLLPEDEQKPMDFATARMNFMRSISSSGNAYGLPLYMSEMAPVQGQFAVLQNALEKTGIVDPMANQTVDGTTYSEGSGVALSAYKSRLETMLGLTEKDGKPHTPPYLGDPAAMDEHINRYQGELGDYLSFTGDSEHNQAMAEAALKELGGRMPATEHRAMLERQLGMTNQAMKLYDPRNQLEWAHTANIMMRASTGKGIVEGEAFKPENARDFFSNIVQGYGDGTRTLENVAGLSSSFETATNYIQKTGQLRRSDLMNVLDALGLPTDQESNPVLKTLAQHNKFSEPNSAIPLSRILGGGSSKALSQMTRYPMLTDQQYTFMGQEGGGNSYTPLLKGQRDAGLKAGTRGTLSQYIHRSKDGKVTPIPFGRPVDQTVLASNYLRMTHEADLPKGQNIEPIFNFTAENGKTHVVRASQLAMADRKQWQARVSDPRSLLQKSMDTISQTILRDRPKNDQSIHMPGIGNVPVSRQEYEDSISGKKVQPFVAPDQKLKGSLSNWRGDYSNIGLSDVQEGDFFNRPDVLSPSLPGRSDNPLSQFFGASSNIDPTIMNWGGNSPRSDQLVRQILGSRVQDNRLQLLQKQPNIEIQRLLALRNSRIQQQVGDGGALAAPPSPSAMSQLLLGAGASPLLLPSPRARLAQGLGNPNTAQTPDTIALGGSSPLMLPSPRELMYDQPQPIGNYRLADTPGTIPLGGSSPLLLPEHAASLLGSPSQLLLGAGAPSPLMLPSPRLRGLGNPNVSSLYHGTIPLGGSSPLLLPQHAASLMGSNIPGIHAAGTFAQVAMTPEQGSLRALLFGDGGNIFRPNLEQQMAISGNATHRIIEGGPGSGKTDTIARAATRWALEGVDPQKIISLSALHSGVGALKEGYGDYQSMLPDEKGIADPRTFHSLAAQIVFQRKKVFDEDGSWRWEMPILKSLGLNTNLGILTDPSARDLAGLPEDIQKAFIANGRTPSYAKYLEGIFGSDIPIHPDDIKDQLHYIDTLKKSADPDYIGRQLEAGQQELLLGNRWPSSLSKNAYFAHYQDMLTDKGMIDFGDLMHFANKALTYPSDESLPRSIREAQGLVVDEAQDNTPVNMGFLGNLLNRMKPGNRRSIIGMDVGQSALTGLGGIPINDIRGSYDQMLAGVGGSVEKHMLVQNQRSSVSDTLFNNAILAQPELEHEAKSPMQVPAPNAPLGTFPDIRAAMSQKSQNAQIIQKMLSMTGLDFHRAKRNMLGYQQQYGGLGGILPEHVMAGMPWKTTTPGQMPIIFPTNSEREMFEHELRGAIPRGLFSGDEHEAMFNAMYRQGAPEARDSDDTRKQAELQFQGLTDFGSRSRSYDYPVRVSSRRGLGLWSPAEWLRNTLIGSSRARKQNTFIATDRYFNESQTSDYLSGRRAGIFETSLNPEEGKTFTYDKRGATSQERQYQMVYQKTADGAKLVNIGHPDPEHPDAYFVPEYMRNIAKEHILSLIQGGHVAANSEFFPKPIREHFIPKIMQEAGLQVPDMVSQATASMPSGVGAAGNMGSATGITGSMGTSISSVPIQSPASSSSISTESGTPRRGTTPPSLPVAATTAPTHITRGGSGGGRGGGGLADALSETSPLEGQIKAQQQVVLQLRRKSMNGGSDEDYQEYLNAHGKLMSMMSGRSGGTASTGGYSSGGGSGRRPPAPPAGSEPPEEQPGSLISPDEIIRTNTPPRGQGPAGGTTIHAQNVNVHSTSQQPPVINAQQATLGGGAKKDYTDPDFYNGANGIAKRNTLPHGSKWYAWDDQSGRYKYQEFGAGDAIPDTAISHDEYVARKRRGIVGASGSTSAFGEPPPPADNTGGSGGGNMPFNNRAQQYGRLLTHLGYEMRFIGQTLSTVANQSITEGGDYRLATLPLAGSGSRGDSGFFNFTDYGPNTLGGQQRQYLGMYSQTQIAQGYRQLAAATNRPFSSAMQNPLTDVMGMSFLSGIDPGQLTGQMSTIAGMVGGPNTLGTIQNLSGIMQQMYGGNLSSLNVTPTLNALQTVLPMLQGIRVGSGSQIPQAMSIFQTALGAGITPGNFDQVSGVIGGLGQMGTNPTLQQQSLLSKLFPGQLTSGVSLAQYNLEQTGRAEQIAQLRLQQNIGGGLSLPQLNIRIDQAQIQMDTANLNMSSVQLGQAQAAVQGAQLQYQYGLASYNLNQSIQNAQYGPIGMDASRTAYFSFLRNKSAAGYNGTSPEIATNPTSAPTFGLKNLEFYAGMENQRQMLILQRTPLLADAAFQQQMKYINQQEAFYQQELKLTNEQRSFEKDWQARLLHQQEIMVGWQQKVVNAQERIYGVQVEELGLNKLRLQYDQKQQKITEEFLGKQIAALQAVSGSQAQNLQGLGPVAGQNVTPSALLQRLASYTKGMSATDTQHILQQVVSPDQVGTLYQLIQQIQSKNLDLNTIQKQLGTTGDAALMKQIQQYLQTGAGAGGQITATTQDQFLHAGGTGVTWDQNVKVVNDMQTYLPKLGDIASSTLASAKSLGEIFGILGPISVGIGTIATILGFFQTLGVNPFGGGGGGGIGGGGGGGMGGGGGLLPGIIAMGGILGNQWAWNNATNQPKQGDVMGWLGKMIAQGSPGGMARTTFDLPGIIQKYGIGAVLTATPQQMDEMANGTYKPPKPPKDTSSRLPPLGGTQGQHASPPTNDQMNQRYRDQHGPTFVTPPTDSQMNHRHRDQGTRQSSPPPKVQDVKDAANLDQAKQNMAHLVELEKQQHTQKPALDQIGKATQDTSKATIQNDVNAYKRHMQLLDQQRQNHQDSINQQQQHNANTVKAVKDNMNTTGHGFATMKSTADDGNKTSSDTKQILHDSKDIQNKSLDHEKNIDVSTSKFGQAFAGLAAGPSHGGGGAGPAGAPVGHPGFITPHVNTEFHQQMNYGGLHQLHQGVDFRAAQGTPLHEFIGGKVVKTGFFPWGGEIDVNLPGTPLIERYLHLSMIGVRPGEMVKRGQFVGLTGGGTVASGLGQWSSGPHSHVQYDTGNYWGGLDPWPIWAIYGATNLSQDYGNQLGVGAGRVGGGGGRGGGVPPLTQMGDGGIALRPMPAILAERGEPEAVVPLSKLSNVLQTLVGSGSFSVAGGTGSGGGNGNRQLMVQKLVETINVNVAGNGTGGKIMSPQEKDELMAEMVEVLDGVLVQLMGRN